jgi:hypothetical protein
MSVRTLAGTGSYPGGAGVMNVWSDMPESPAEGGSFS